MKTQRRSLGKPEQQTPLKTLLEEFSKEVVAPPLMIGEWAWNGWGLVSHLPTLFFTLFPPPLFPSSLSFSPSISSSTPSTPHICFPTPLPLLSSPSALPLSFLSLLSPPSSPPLLLLPTATSPSSPSLPLLLPLLSQRMPHGCTVPT